jgi:hypothetical protein
VTLTGLKNSKQAAVSKLFKHLTNNDLCPKDEMETQLALNVVSAETIQALDATIVILKDGEDIGAKVTLGQVESLRDYLALLGAVDSAFRKNKSLTEIEAALKALDDYMTDNLAIIAGLDASGESVRYAPKKEWEAAASVNAQQRYENAACAAAADGEEAGGDAKDRVTFQTVATLDDSVVIIAARSILLKPAQVRTPKASTSVPGKPKKSKPAPAPAAPAGPRREYLVRHVSLNGGEPTWVPEAALPPANPGDPARPTPRAAQHRNPDQTTNMMAKVSRDSLKWNLRSIRSVAGRIRKLKLRKSRPRYWSTNRVENHNSLHRAQTPFETAKQYAENDSKATFLMQIENSKRFRFGRRKWSYARAPDADDKSESDGDDSGDDDDDLAPAAPLSPLSAVIAQKKAAKRARADMRASTSEDEDAVIDLTVATIKGRQEWAKKQNDAAKEGQRGVKPSPHRKFKRRDGADSEDCKDLEDCVGCSCSGDGCQDPDRRATQEAIGKAIGSTKKGAAKLPGMAMVTCGASQGCEHSMHLQCLGRTTKSKDRNKAAEAIREGDTWLCVSCLRAQPKQRKNAKASAATD